MCRSPSCLSGCQFFHWPSVLLRGSLLFIDPDHETPLVLSALPTFPPALPTFIDTHVGVFGVLTKHGCVSFFFPLANWLCDNKYSNRSRCCFLKIYISYFISICKAHKLSIGSFLPVLCSRFTIQPWWSIHWFCVQLFYRKYKFFVQFAALCNPATINFMVRW